MNKNKKSITTTTTNTSEEKISLKTYHMQATWNIPLKIVLRSRRKRKGLVLKNLNLFLIILKGLGWLGKRLMHITISRRNIRFNNSRNIWVSIQGLSRGRGQRMIGKLIEIMPWRKYLKFYWIRSLLSRQNKRLKMISKKKTMTMNSSLQKWARPQPC